MDRCSDYRRRKWLDEVHIATFAKMHRNQRDAQSQRGRVAIVFVGTITILQPRPLGKHELFTRFEDCLGRFELWFPWRVIYIYALQQEFTPMRALTAILTVAFMGFAVNVGTAYDVIKVEETWELTIGDPSIELNAPQVTMCMSPYANSTSEYFALTLNFRTQPDYVPGGMQLSVYNDESLTSFVHAPIGGSLDQGTETVQWTQTMTLSDGLVTFDLANGTSSSWGSFGGPGWLRQSIRTGGQNLNGYRPAVSLAESEIGYAGNRVASLTLKRIRWYASNGKVYEVNAPFDIDTDLDPWANEDLGAE